MAEPLWQKNLRDAILLNPLVLLHGNVKDLFPIGPGNEARLPEHLRQRPYLPFDSWLAVELERMGFDAVLIYDPADGAVVLRGNMAGRFQEAARSRPGGGSAAAPPQASTPRAATSTTTPTTASAQASALPRAEATPVPADGWMARLDPRQEPEAFFRTLYDNVLPRRDYAVAVVCRFTDRYLSFTDRQGAADRSLSLLIQKATMAIPPQPTADRVNSRIVLVFNTAGEIPQELNAQAPFSQSVSVPLPTLEEREQFFRDNAALFNDSEPGDRFDPRQDPEHLRLVANLSDGLHHQELLSLAALSRHERLGLGRSQVKSLLDRFRYGTRENAWQKVKPEMLRNAKEVLGRRVKGQDEVIDEVIPVLIRAKLGMSDISASSHSSKPRGAFFFVGPTGVGKTELSKSIAELIFGDENALIRFDMSEYSEEHQQARLIGAPPGYVGFDQGGQLTNAILAKPFSVVLFDEVEKAHGRILDKFLQVLDDGRLTDGMGRTVYFSEAILIFTSNLGTAPRQGRASRGATAPGPEHAGADMSSHYDRLGALSYPDLCDHFRREVKDYFVNTLGRPEILNRIGEDNVLVFKFLNDESAKTKIVDQQVETLDRYLREKHQVGVFCTKAFKRLLMAHPSGFGRNGARGVRNLLNKLVLNPLAHQLFLEQDKCHMKTFKVDYRLPLDSIDREPFDKSALQYEWVAS